MSSERPLIRSPEVPRARDDVARTHPSSHGWRGLLLVSSAGAIWGTIGPVVQVVHETSGLSPLVIGGYRATAALSVLVLASLATARVRELRAVVRCHPRRVVATGVATAVFQLLFFVSVVAVGVSAATVVSLGLAPVLLLGLHCVRRRRAPTAAQTVTVSAALVGLGLVGLAGGTGDHAPDPVVGLLAAVGSGIAYAMSTDWGAPLSREYDALTVATATTTVAGAVVLIPAALVLTSLGGGSLAVTGGWSWVLLVYLGVVTMALAYVLLYAGLRSTSSRAAVVATLLEPVTAVLIAVLFLAERLTAASVVGALLIFAAIAALGRTSEEQPQAQ